MTDPTRHTDTPHRRRTAGRAVAVIVGAVIVLSGCSVPRGGDSATSDIAGCAAVLPVAHDTVRGSGTLVLVHRLSSGDVSALYAAVGAPPPTPPVRTPSPRSAPPSTPAGTQKPPKACLVVYQGDYRPGTVTGADPAQHGRYALIVARVRHPLVERVLLTDELPRPLPGS